MSRTTFAKISIAILLCAVSNSSANAQTSDTGNNAFSWVIENSADSSLETTIRFLPGDGVTVLSWSFSDSRISNEISPVLGFSKKQSGRIVATLSYSLNGLTLKESKSILLPTAIKVKLTDIPNVFTPNDDTVNDLFTVATVGTPRFVLRIMSRSGALLYEHESDVIRWDGRNDQGNELPEGIYYYIIEDLTESYEPATGFVYLFRGKK